MMLLPGTHHPYVDLESHQAPSGSIVSREVDVSPELEETAVTIQVPAGSVSIHDSCKCSSSLSSSAPSQRGRWADLLHGSGYNTSGNRRAAYTIRYLNARLGFCDTEQHPVPAFLVRGEAGSHGASYIDARPGCTPPVWTNEVRPSPSPLHSSFSLFVRRILQSPGPDSPRLAQLIEDFAAGLRGDSLGPVGV